MSAGLQYAEQTLGVHSVYNEATALLTTLDDATTLLDKARDARWTLTEEIADREADLVIQERGANPTMSATALDQHLKVVKRKDGMLLELRHKLGQIQAEISGLELDMDMTKHRLRVATARMEELGGYLSFLAHLKQAETLTTLTQLNGAT